MRRYSKTLKTSSIPLQPTLSPEVFPANLSVLPGSAAARRTTAISGRRCFESYGYLLPDGSLLKMLAASLLGAGEWYSTECVLIWKAQITKSGRLYFRLRASVPTTGASGYGLLPIATTKDSSGGAVLAYQTPKGWERRSKSGKKHGAQLHDVIKTLGMLPTLVASDARGPSYNRKRKGSEGIKLVQAIGGGRGGRKLSPAFAMWHMGYPEDWCDLEVGAVTPLKPPATPSSRKSPQR